MIVVNVIGGLGNQMFQYAAGRSLAKRLGVPLVLDLRAYATYDLHPYALDRFRLAAEVVQARELPDWPVLLHRAQRKLHAWGYGGRRYYFEPGMRYDHAFERIKAGTYITGYFQTDRYFGDVPEDLATEFQLRDPLDARNQAVLGEITAGGPKVVALHIRRGDYVTDPTTASIHGVMGAEYYAAALDMMRRRIGEFRCAVFSNDLDWARRTLGLGKDTLFVDGNQARAEIDLTLMAACDHQIIANSTFSWWAAWLNRNADKVVIAPKNWFASADRSDAEVLPARWHRV